VSFLPSYIYIITLSFLVSLSVYSKTKNYEFYLKLFPPFLLTTIIIEFVASYMSNAKMNNMVLYNCFSTYEFCFYLFVIGHIVSSRKIKRLMWIGIIPYAIAAFVNIFFIQDPKVFHSTTYSIGCLLIVLYCIYYFLEIFRLPKSVSLKNSSSFWICSGLLFFYICGFPLFGLINKLADISKLIIRTFDEILTILNIFLYSLFTIAFLCRLKIRKYILSSS
jgi:hypothetical protein